MRLFKRLLATTVLIVALLAVLAFLVMQLSTFGANPSGERLERIKRSPNYKNGSFQNLSPTAVIAENTSYWQTARDFFNKPKDNVPPAPLPSVKTDLKALPDNKTTVVWFGHSSYLIKSKGTTILADPVFSGNASPVSFFGSAYPGSNVYDVASMPTIDMLVLSHDHYDHLDFATIVKLIPKVKMFYTGLGVGAHLQRWGVPADRIVEFDWWDTQQLSPDIELTATPARHFSGRSLARGKTLWTSYVLNLHGDKLFLGGDSGYDTHFRKIGDKFGPFDLAILECGQYGEGWPDIHMFPEQTAQAALDLRAKALLPVHWAKFSLANHSWNEPVQRLLASEAAQGLDITTPRIGEPIIIGAANPKAAWWAF
ncbi:MBL fold metallo-hydrolase [Spirosoma sp. KUDC1026]|uniref:MBL fold metallo-hydrolase n=1 Tax=Spirosoma sp. KUDC1026 TaxID=2745947 RepID=UPI00159BAE9D|nr:MBL fold metallo-hydrolase [Spirosoma sp. KUDC1026]QKZ13159.1 MBL fold metallo-hydrolase [Spirosoma sp. KUDC1026]